MPILGLIPEPPFDPQSWSGSSAPFFAALKRNGTLLDARHVTLTRSAERLHQLRTFSLPLHRWKERYHTSVARFQALTAAAQQQLAVADVTGVLQVGAWFSSPAITDLPCFGYHDGNAAQRYRHYGRGLLSSSWRDRHLDWERSVYRRLHGIFVMSSWLATSFTRDFGVPAARVHVVGAGVNLASVPVVPARDYGTPRFLMVGRNFERKGGRYLLEAFRKVRAEIPTAELVLVGPRLHIAESGVTCVGFLPKSDPSGRKRLHDLFLRATAVVLPSVYEPFGISLIEGMMYGLPCIAADRCAMPEIVEHNRSGLIVPAEDSSALAAAMTELATDPAWSRELGLAGRARAERDYTWPAVADKIKVVLGNSYNVK